MAKCELIVGIKNNQIVITDTSGAPKDIKHTHRRDQDHFVWECDPGTVQSFTIDFTSSPPSPFKSQKTHFESDGNCRTSEETIDDGKSGSIDYKYTVTAKAKGGAPDPPPYDPHIIVDDDSLNNEDCDQLSDAEEISVTRTRATLTAAKDAGGDTLNGAIELLTKAATVTSSNGKPYFFPDGIQTISVDVELTPIKVKIKVTGK
jgi:hypothetical protein